MIIPKRKINSFLRLVKFDNQGLVLVVIQDDKDKTVLMVAYTNRTGLRITLTEGQVCFWSRSRQKLWRKGESSGNVQIVKSIALDCDGDCLLIRVEQMGGASCHTGYRSCFYRKLSSHGKVSVAEKKIFDPRTVY